MFHVGTCAGKGVTAEVHIPNSQQGELLASALLASPSSPASSPKQQGRVVRASVGNAAMMAAAGVAIPPAADLLLRDLEVNSMATTKPRLLLAAHCHSGAWQHVAVHAHTSCASRLPCTVFPARHQVIASYQDSTKW